MPVEENYGRVQNWGYEGLINMRIIDSRKMTFDLAINGSIMDNKLIQSNDTGPIPGGYGLSNYYENKVGYPLISNFDRRIIRWGDYNHNGRIESNEIVVDTGQSWLGQ